VVVSRAVHGGPRWWKTELGSGAYRSGQQDGDADETQGEGSFYSRASCKGNTGLRKGNGIVWHAASRAGSAWWQSVACTCGGWAQQEGHGEEICSYVVVLATLERVKRRGVHTTQKGAPVHTSYACARQRPSRCFARPRSQQGQRGMLRSVLVSRGGCSWHRGDIAVRQRQWCQRRRAAARGDLMVA
jgi:hypothetical protein